MSDGITWDGQPIAGLQPDDALLVSPSSQFDAQQLLPESSGSLHVVSAVFANSGHAYAKFAGLRFDTSMTPGAGPGWRARLRRSNIRPPTEW